ncbi:hypothetical protein [Wolbachia endosymbiont (group B) of Endotricha flammealis]|nr:hypothetical protein [Wolbachia endosymbiont (group B) of Endotricha flammealis]
MTHFFERSRRQPRDLKLAYLREVPMLWSDQLEKFYGFNLQKQ